MACGLISFFFLRLVHIQKNLFVLSKNENEMVYVHFKAYIFHTQTVQWGSNHFYTISFFRFFFYYAGRYIRDLLFLLSLYQMYT